MKRKNFLFFILFLLMPIFVSAEDLKLKWETNYGGSEYEWFNQLLYSYDESGNIDGYVVSGESDSTDIPGNLIPNSNYTGIFVKYDLDGNIVFQKNMSDIDAHSDVNNIFYEYDKDGKVIGYILFISYGTENTNSCYHSKALVYDLNGNLKKEKEFLNELMSGWPQLKPIYGEGNKIEGYYYLDYYFNRDSSADSTMYIYVGMKLDLNLEVLNTDEYIFEKRYFIEDSYNVVGEHDGYISATRDSLIKLNYDMEEEWVINLGFLPERIVISKDAQGKYDGYVVIENHTGKVYKYALDGNLVWSSQIPSHYTAFYSDGMLTYNSDGVPDGYLYGGEYSEDSDNKHRKVILSKISLDGELLWEKYFGSDTGYDGIYTRTGNGKNLLMSYDKNGNYDGYYILVTDSNSTDIPGIVQDDKGNAIFLKYDFDGNIIWQHVYGGNDGWDVGDNLCYSYDSSRNIDGVIFMMSDTSTNFGTIVNKGYYDPVLVKFGYDYIDLEINVMLNDKREILYSNQEAIEYRVVVKNNGNVKSKNNIISTIIPNKFKIVENSISNNGVYDSNNRSVVWQEDEINIGETLEYTFKIIADDDLDQIITFKSDLNSDIVNNLISNEVVINYVENPETGEKILFTSVLILILVLLILIYQRNIVMKRKTLE